MFTVVSQNGRSVEVFKFRSVVVPISSVGMQFRRGMASGGEREGGPRCSSKVKDGKRT